MFIKGARVHDVDFGFVFVFCHYLLNTILVYRNYNFLMHNFLISIIIIKIYFLVNFNSLLYIVKEILKI